MTGPDHQTMRRGWRHWAARDVVVTVQEPGRVLVEYTDGHLGEPKARSFQTLADIDVQAMQWVTWTLVLPDGTRNEHKGWRHSDFDDVSSPEADAAEWVRREAVRDAHPRSREIAWCSYDTQCEYNTRGLATFRCEAPDFPRPTQEEIDASPL